MKKIAVIGSGSWGVALAVHLAKLGNEVKIWSFMQEEPQTEDAWYYHQGKQQVGLHQDC